MKIVVGSLFMFLLLWVSCDTDKTINENERIDENTGSQILILGTAQDAGSPQINCKKACCADLFDHPSAERMVTSIGLYDATTDRTYLFEATTDIAKQAHLLDLNKRETSFIDGIFLTHAHIGHYSGLMYLGKEAMDAKAVDTYVMARMDSFLRTNGPWSQLVARENIRLKRIVNEEKIQLSDSLSVLPFIVPHRDEFSETVGYKIIGPNKSALFIPDIDKWSKWEKDIVEEIKKVDYAFLDATFYDAKEINNRDISEIPHPFVSESMARFEQLPAEEKSKVVFIHFNHTNPLLDDQSIEFKETIHKGFHVASIGDCYAL